MATDMTPYFIGWSILTGASFLLSLVAFFWSRSVLGFFSSFLLSAMLFVFLIIPAPIPNYQGYFAPAYVVFVFETFFQTKGSSAISGQVLSLALGTVFILMVAGRYFSIKKKR